MCSLASLLSSNRQRSEHGRSRAPGAVAISQRSRFEPSATLGYGIPVFGGRFTGTPKIGLGLSDTDRELKLGWRLGLSFPASRRTTACTPCRRRQARKERAPGAQCSGTWRRGCRRAACRPLAVASEDSRASPRQPFRLQGRRARFRFATWARTPERAHRGLCKECCVLCTRYRVRRRAERHLGCRRPPLPGALRTRGASGAGIPRVLRENASG